VVVKLVHLDEGCVPILLACFITEHPSCLGWMGTRYVMDEGSDEILRGGWFLFLVLSELEGDLVPKELALFRSEVAGEHARGASFFRHFVVASRLGDVVREAAMVRTELIQLLLSLLEGSDDVIGLLLGFERCGWSSVLRG